MTTKQQRALAWERQTRVAALKAEGMRTVDIVEAVKTEYTVPASYNASKVARDYAAFQRRETHRVDAAEQAHLERRLTVLADRQQSIAEAIQERLIVELGHEVSTRDLVLLANAVVGVGKSLRELRGLDAPRTLNIRHLIEQRVRIRAEARGVDPVRVLDRVETWLNG